MSGCVTDVARYAGWVVEKHHPRETAGHIFEEGN
jgi:hypothetical protein